MTAPVVMPAMNDPQRQAWWALLDVCPGDLSKKDRNRLRRMVVCCRDDPAVMLGEDADLSLRRLVQATGLDV